MNFNNYTDLAVRTLKPMSAKQAKFNSFFGLVGEIGEVADLLKKHFFQGHDLNLEKLKDECGDVLWYTAVLWDNTGRSADMENLYRFGQLIGNDHLVRTYDSDIEYAQYYIERITEQCCSPNPNPQTIYNFIARLLEMYAINIEDAMEGNIKKLEKRYPNLRFEQERSINREN